MMMSTVLLLSISYLTATPDIDSASFGQKLHQALWGNFNEFDDNPSEAFFWDNRVVEDPTSPGYMYRGILNLFARQQNTHSILYLMPKIDQTFTDDIPMQLIFAKALYDSGYVVPADEKVIALVQRTKDNQEVTLLATQLYMRRGELENAALTLKDYLAATPENMHHAMFHLLLAQIYLNMHDYDTALQSVHKVLNQNPSFPQGWLLYALLHEKKEHLSGAMRGYLHYLARGANHPGVTQHIQQLAEKQRDSASGKGNQEQLTTAQVTQMLELLKQAKFEQAAEYIDSCLPETCNKVIFNTSRRRAFKPETALWTYMEQFYTNFLVQPLFPAQYITKPYSYCMLAKL